MADRGSLEERNLGTAGLRCAYLCKVGAHRGDCQLQGDIPGQYRSIEQMLSRMEHANNEASPLLSRPPPSCPYDYTAQQSAESKEPASDLDALTSTIQ